MRAVGPTAGKVPVPHATSRTDEVHVGLCRIHVPYGGPGAWSGATDYRGPRQRAAGSAVVLGLVEHLWIVVDGRLAGGSCHVNDAPSRVSLACPSELDFLLSVLLYEIVLPGIVQRLSSAPHQNAA